MPVNVCVVHIPTEQDKVSLHTDGSGADIGGVLNVVRRTDELLVWFHVRKLCEAECHYSTIEQEALAVIVCVRYFAHYLYGCHVLS